MTIQKPLFLFSIAAAAISLAACAPSPVSSRGADRTTPDLPVDTASPNASPEPSSTPATNEAGDRCNQVRVWNTRFYPDAVEFLPGTDIHVEWLLKNTGTCSWTSEYQLVFDHADLAAEPATQPLTTEPVKPGMFTYVSVFLKAPDALGTYEAFFKIRAPDGSTFGSGADAADAMSVKIVVVAALSTPIIQPSPTLTAPRATATVDPAAPAYAVHYVTDVTIPDGWEVGPDTVFTKTWRLQNTGREALWNDSTLVFDHGDRMGAPGSEALVKGGDSVQPGGIFDVSLDLVSPSSAGTYQAFFKVFFAHGPGERNGSYGDITLWVKIRVIAPTATPAGGPVTQVVSKQTTISPGNKSSVAVACPAGTAVTGGGFSSSFSAIADPFSGLEPKLNVYESHMEGNGWTVSAWSLSMATQTLGVQAVCLTHPSAITTVVEKTILVKGGTVLAADAACPAGSVITGGGFSGEEFFIRSSEKWANGWRVAAMTYQKDFPELTAYAVCLSGAPATVIIQNGAKNILQYASGYAAAECPGGSALTGGGFGNPNDLDLDEASIHGRSWIVHAGNVSTSNARFETYAVCLKLT